MRKGAVLLVAAVVLVGGAVVAGRAPQASGADVAKIMDFDTMVGVPRPYTGATNAIRDVPGGGLPWVVDSAKGKLRADGRLDIMVKGLVFDPNDQAVIDRGLAGINTIPNFKAIVSCLSKDANGDATTVNVSTGLFPASEAGDSTISDTIVLPEPCIAPIVFVTSPGGAWFAATGF